MLVYTLPVVLINCPLPPLPDSTLVRLLHVLFGLLVRDGEREGEEET